MIHTFNLGQSIFTLCFIWNIKDGFFMEKVFDTKISMHVK